MTLIEAAKLALEALKELHDTTSYWWQEVDEATLAKMEPAITALRTAIAEAEKQEPTVCLPRPVWDAVLRVNEFAETHVCTTPPAAQPVPVQEPVAWEDGPHLVVRSDMRERLNYKGPWVDMGRAIPDKWVPVLYTTPPAAQPQRTWVGLTDEETIQVLGNVREKLDGNVFGSFAKGIEAKLKEKNT
jgi:hypothetical protein